MSIGVRSADAGRHLLQPSLAVQARAAKPHVAALGQVTRPQASRFRPERGHVTPVRWRLALFRTGLLGACLAACGGDGGTGLEVPVLRVTVTTSGTDLDPDGYTLVIDKRGARPVDINATVNVEPLAEGQHSIQLTGVAANCAIQGANPRIAKVQAGKTTNLDFLITCAAPAAVGSIEVTTTTGGGGSDPDGYTLLLDGLQSQGIGVSATATLGGVRPGTHAVGLSDLSANCAAQGENPRTVAVAAGQQMAISFTVNCEAAPPSSGTLQVTTATTGASLDLDGYVLELDGGAGQPVGVNATVTLANLATGTHTLALSGLAANCHVEGDNPSSVMVQVGGTAEIAFNISCATVLPPVASVLVTPASVTLSLGRTAQLVAELRAADGSVLTGPSVAWASSDEAVVAVDPNGLATGTGAGMARITAAVEGVEGAAAITVTLAAFQQVSAGGGPDDHSCGVTAARDAYCWGLNADGQLGNGTHGANTGSNVPVLVSGGLAFASVSAGAGVGPHSCGITTSGAAYCWGNNRFGQLGNGSSNIFADVPVVVSGGLTFISVSAGTFHSCGVTLGGAAYCWGANGTGQLGNGTNTSSSVPAAVSGNLTFASVSAGVASSCGLTTGGAAYCWGRNAEGQLGDGTTADSNVPTPVSGGLTFVSLSESSYHRCGLTTDGVAYCWGLNGNGQLGAGIITINSTVPVRVSSGLAFAFLSAGEFHSCGVTTDGAAYCWGHGAFGQLGDGRNTSSDVPVTVSGGLVFTFLSGGGSHSCGVTTGAAVYCWGSNRFGQLGDGTSTDRNVPVAIVPP